MSKPPEPLNASEEASERAHVEEFLGAPILLPSIRARSRLLATLDAEREARASAEREQDEARELLRWRDVNEELPPQDPQKKEGFSIQVLVRRKDEWSDKWVYSVDRCHLNIGSFMVALYTEWRYIESPSKEPTL